MNKYTTKHYRALVAEGHSALKAAQIVLDANRGDNFSQRWIGIVYPRWLEILKAKKHVQA